RALGGMAGVHRRHALGEPGRCALGGPHCRVRAASTAVLDIRVNLATADPAAVFPGVSITPQRLICEAMSGWAAKIRGTNEEYVYARTFLNRSREQPYGWPLPGNGLYECREIGPYGKFSCFFEVKGAFRRRVQLVTPEQADRMARRMGPKPSE
ncbi:hypothetical protein ABT173_49190, partial [Streptomyces sp. NPDC001795]|uniref:hypothetical protein n=1 Tax=Streptomyces sp. NPDC001795 TaxID=3154525 RepID=UPI003326DECC